MAAKARTSASAKKASSKETTSTTVKKNGSKGGANEPQQLPLLSRLVIIILTSWVAEKIWRYRAFVSQGWYSDKQTPTEQNMIKAFEYIVAMGLLFFMGILISSATVRLQAKLGL